MTPNSDGEQSPDGTPDAAGVDKRRPADILDPPKDFISSIRYLGPGLILSAAIVGSGELIATTSLGAQAGFAVLWVILLGCFIKVAVQLQFGRHTIMHGEASFASWNRGRRGIHWSVFCGMLYLIGMLAGQAGVLGGSIQTLQYAFPNMHISVLIVLLAAVLGLLTFRGRYKETEILATVFNVIFVSLVLYCAVAVQWTDYAFTIGDLSSGFSLSVPAGALTLALTAFGITGLSAGEIFVYPTWCIEKGYAAWTGPKDDTPEWAARARGWMRVMTYDALLSMVVYTVATIAFYILGAAVLHRQGLLLDGEKVVLQLSSIITDVLGENSIVIFMAGAFMVLFSTLFANVACHSRLWVDFFNVLGVVDKKPETRKRALSILAFVLPAIWGIIYLCVQDSLLLVVVLGITNSVFLLVVAYQALRYRYLRTEKHMAPSRAFDVFLWLSILTIGVMALRIVWNTYNKAFGG